MKNLCKPLFSLIILLNIVFIYSCKEDEPTIAPTAVTGTVSAITSNSANVDGQITSDGNSDVTERGIVYGTTSNPTVSNNKAISGSGIGTFTSNLTNLTSATTYFVRAYATNSVGTSYGLEVSFKTLGVLGSVTTTNVTAITGVSATSGGNITDDGGVDITARGVCWSTSPNPTIANSKTTDGSGKGSFSSSIVGLTNGTKYYVRAYATNSIGTSYGNEVNFITLSTPTLTTTAISLLTSVSATSGGNITDDGGANITVRGVCWSTSPNPTIVNSNTVDGNGKGSFNSSISGLANGTKYYVRAYATNSIGTSYGNEVNFTTLSPPTLTTTAISLLTSVSATSGGNITDNGGADITARGVCWSTSPNPSIANSKTTDGIGSGSFSSTLSNLSPITTYYVRAYASNSVGTSYGNEITITTLGVVDIDGNIYSAVVIGTQIWMKENLKVSKYLNGDAIPNVTDNNTWTALTTGAYSYYNNDATKNITYGKLYNWYAVTDSRSLCPSGWHMPSNSDWSALSTYLGGTSVAGGKMKSTGTTYWQSPNTGATNESGFSGLPAGVRLADTGNFITEGQVGYWWTSTQNISINNWAYNRFLQYNLTQLSISNDSGNPFQSGFSVRCIKD